MFSSLEIGSDVIYLDDGLSFLSVLLDVFGHDGHHLAKTKTIGCQL